MGRTDKVAIDNVVEDLFEVRKTALALVGENEVNVDDVFFMETLVDVEDNIKKLNEYSDKCWLLSAILLYSLVYDKEMYLQSGLNWEEYKKQSKERLGMTKDDISRTLSSARFFIKYHKALEKAGWKPNGSAFKMSYGEHALEISGDIDETIKHLVNDSWREFRNWCNSFKELPPPQPIINKSIQVEKNKVTINGIEAVTISDKLPKEQQDKLNELLSQVFIALRNDNYPAIVECYDEKEAKLVPRLLNKHRSNR